MTGFSILCPNDELILRLIPHYADMVDVMVRLLPSAPEPRKILDLGAGPGRISEVIHKRMPTARLTLLDSNEDVLAIAGRRLANAAPAIVVGDFTTVDLGSGYDAIVAGLTLHHLTDSGKQGMTTRLWDALADDGLLVVSDIVRGSTPSWDQRYEEMWLDHIADLPPKQLENVLRHYREHDRPATVEDQLRWLEEAGFTEVACHWRHLNFAVFSGQKGSARDLDPAAM